MVKNQVRLGAMVFMVRVLVQVEANGVCIHLATHTNCKGAANGISPDMPRQSAQDDQTLDARSSNGVERGQESRISFGGWRGNFASSLGEVSAQDDQMLDARSSNDVERGQESNLSAQDDQMLDARS